MPEITSVEIKKAYLEFMLVEEISPTKTDLIVIGNLGVRRGIVVDVGSEVPELSVGDEVCFQDCYEVDGVLVVHFAEVLFYKRFTDVL